MASLVRDFWLQWSLRTRGGLWSTRQGHEGLGWYLPEEEEEIEDELAGRIGMINLRNKGFRDTTRYASLVLLNASRLLLLASPIPVQAYHLGISPSTQLIVPILPPQQARTASLTSSSSIRSSSTSSSPSSSDPVSPILAIPYEVLDIILSHLSFGHLSSAQHPLVMNWAGDRSTLGANKADSRNDFLCKTNCWRWESEVERVNQGHGYE